ncbi:MAG TPA: cytochrome c [Burkholderiales bacterium]|nr:cytochrome c [Burkholderiales bacterium]HUK05346.1 cytochrome c [Burkholderiales bacterium]
MNKKLLLTGLAVALGAGVTHTALAQVKPEILVKQRQAAMTLQAKYFGPLAGMAQGKVPYNADTVAMNAALLDALSRMPWDGFAPASKEATVKNAALPAVWSEPAKFKQAQDTFQNAVQNLVKVSRGGDEGAQKAAIGGIGKACGGCHENFREKQ